MNMPTLVNHIVDLASFLFYIAVLGKIALGWLSVRKDQDAQRRHRLAAVLLLLVVVIVCFLAANVYALAFYGSTYLSLYVFQMFIMGNCLVYWLVVDILTKDSAPTAQGPNREPTA